MVLNFFIHIINLVEINDAYIILFCFVIQDAKNNMAVLSASSKVAGLTDGGAARDDKRDQRRKKASG